MMEALYQRIAEALRQRILGGGHQVGDVLPSENELAAAYRTTRTTVRRAFQLLEAEGLIKARKGKGYIVQPPRHTVFTLIFGENSAQGKYRYLGVNMVSADAAAAGALQLREGALVVALRRVLERDGTPVAFDEKFIPYERGMPSVELELHFSEFPDMFAGRFASLSLYTEMDISAQQPPDEVLELLGCPGQRLLTVCRLVRASGGQPIGYGREYLTDSYGALSAASGRYETVAE